MTDGCISKHASGSFSDPRRRFKSMRAPIVDIGANTISVVLCRWGCAQPSAGQWPISTQTRMGLRPRLTGANTQCNHRSNRMTVTAHPCNCVSTFKMACRRKRDPLGPTVKKRSLHVGRFVDDYGHLNIGSRSPSGWSGSISSIFRAEGPQDTSSRRFARSHVQQLGHRAGLSTALTVYGRPC